MHENVHNHSNLPVTSCDNINIYKNSTWLINYNIKINTHLNHNLKKFIPQKWVKSYKLSHF